MKLSDVKGERVFDVIADIIDPVAAIATSDEFRELMEPRKAPKGVDDRTYALQRIRRLMPKLIRSHKASFAAIMASINDTTPEEYMEGLTLQSLYKDVTDLLTDDTFTDFFTSVAPSTARSRHTSE